MDGNRRWARMRGLPALSGHRRTADEILEPLVEHAARCGIKYITFWAWSTENWKRNKREVEGVMKLFRHVIAKRWQKLHEKGVRIQVIGDISQFDSDIKDSLLAVVEQTKDNKKITAIFALNYGGRDEIVRAINKYVHSSQFKVQSSKLADDEFEKFLDTQDIPDPDIIIRPGGEKRLSGFLLWQCAYSELFFPSWFMPEFTPEKFDEILEEYRGRKRRFGR